MTTTVAGDDPTRADRTMGLARAPETDQHNGALRSFRRGSSRAPIRVAYCVSTLQTGGSELNAIRCAERLRGEFEFTIFYNRGGPLAQRCEATGMPVVRLPLRNLYGAHAARQGLSFCRRLRNDGFDLVHSHDIYMNMFVAPWAALSGVPFIASRRWWHDRTERRRYWLPNAIAYRLARRVLANSDAVARSLRAHDHVSAGRIAVVPNFVEEEAFRPLRGEQQSAIRANWKIAPDDLVLGVIARLDPVKDHATLFRAVRRLRERWSNLRLVVVGAGSIAHDLESLAYTLGIRDSITFVGEQPREPNLHSLFDISVLCSKSEAFPNSIVEAMAAGRPVVASHVGAIPDAVQAGITGLLAKPGDDEAFAQAIESLLLDPLRRRELGANGKRRARALFHADTVLPRLAALYRDVLSTARRSGQT